MAKTVITMNSGEKFYPVATIEELERMFKNQMGVTINGFVGINPGEKINPTNISSIKVEEE